MKRLFPLLLMTLSFSNIVAQDDLLSILDNEQTEETIYAESTFKGLRLINGHTVVTRKSHDWAFVIMHRFGRINSGIDDFFGLDVANIRLAMEYGINDNITVSIGRNSHEKLYDGFVKYKLFKQSTGLKNMPVTVTGLSSIAIRTLDNPSFAEDDFASKIAYTHQLIVAREFSSELSLQLMPSFVHRNKVMENQKNDIFALGFGGRVKLNNRLSIIGEYYYRFTEEETNEFYDSMGIGLEIETGGHVFQLNFTNSRSMVEKGFITETDGEFFNGDIHFGFNISRVF